MAQDDLSSGDSTPRLTTASIKDITTAVNEWYRMIELTNDLTTTFQFNKSHLTLGSVTAKNTAADANGFKLQTTTGAIAGQLWGDEANSACKVESGNYPLWLNAAPTSSYISLRVHDTQIAQVNSTGVGIGMTPSENLSVGAPTNGTSVVVGLYTKTAAAQAIVSKITQDATSGNLTINYGTGAGGTGKYLVLSGNSGGQIYADAAGNLGINNAGPIYSAYTSSKYITIRGPGGPGAIELSSNAADATNLIQGSLYISDINNVGADRRLAAIELVKVGTTANNRGGAVVISTKPDGSNGILEAMRINNARQVLIGVNTPYGTENVRIHAGGGAKLVLSDSNNASYIASVPSVTSSELALGSNNAEAVRIDKSQNVGIQTSTPAAKLDIAGNAAGSIQAIFARGGDVSFQLHASTVSGTNISGDTLFSFGTKYTSPTLTSGLIFVRGAASNNMSLGLVADSTQTFSLYGGFTNTNVPFNTYATTGNIASQTAVTHTGGLTVQTNIGGVAGTDGAFINFINKTGSSAFAVGLDADGGFKVGGGSFGANAYKIHHDGYNPGVMVARGSLPFTDADLYRPTGMYQMMNPGNSASYSILEFADIGGSSTRVQQVFLYGNNAGATYSGDEMYFRVSRDTQTNWDGFGVLGNRVWHSSNLINPLSANADIANQAGFVARNTAPVNTGEVWVATPAYGSQGDGRTHFGYKNPSGWYNFIRGDTTWIDQPGGRLSLGTYEYVTNSSAYLTISYTGQTSQYGITLNNNSGNNSTAVCFVNSGTNTAAGTITGTITVTSSGTAYNQTSDLRLKTNVKLAPSALEIVRAVNVISYDMKSDGAHVEYGYGAQQLHQHAPQAVTPGSEGDETPTTSKDTWQVDNSKMVPIHHKALQEILDRMDAQDKLITELRDEIQSLRMKVPSKLR